MAGSSPATRLGTLRTAGAGSLCLALYVLGASCSGPPPEASPGGPISPVDAGSDDAEPSSTSDARGPGDGASEADSSGSLCPPGWADCTGVGSCATRLDNSSDHCGACGNRCQGSPCVGGRCAPLRLAAQQGQPNAIAIHSGIAYWASPDLGSVFSCRLSGCASKPVQVWSSGEAGTVFFVAADSHHVYWNDNKHEHIWRCPRAGCALGTVPWLSKDQLSTLKKPTAIAVDSDSVYWHSQAGVIHRAAKSSGSAAVLASGVGSHGAVASDGQVLAWSEISQRRVVVCELPSCSPKTVVAKNVLVQAALAIVDGSAIFGTKHSKNSTTDGFVAKVSVSGGIHQVLADGLGTVGAVAARSGTVYFVDESPAGQLGRVAAAGGTPEVLAAGLNSPAGVAVGDGFVVVALAGTGEIWRYQL